MDKNAIKKYAVWARRELIERVSQRAMIYGITSKDAGDPNAESVNGHLLSQAEKRQRQALIRNIKTKGYEQVMEEVAYTWFNRFAALRFMEVNGYLPSHIRVFTNDAGEFKPQILAEAIHLELDGLDMNKVYELESANKSEELFKYLLIVQCNALNSILPGMFQRIEDYTELLLPDYLLREGSVIEQMVTTIPEKDWTDQVQIIGWLYQYYNTEPKDNVFAALKKNIKINKENIPAATQLFTPDWIVHYMVENSLGRLWLEGHPNDALKSEWKYYLDEAEQEPEVQAQLDIIRKEYAALKPEEIRVIDPCMGSGHILCVLFDVLVRIYEDYGYTAREAAVKIVENNLWGLDIDERAAQLSYFAVVMKARQYDRRFFTRKVQPHVYAIEESNGITSAPMHDMGLNLSQEEYGIAAKQAMRLVEEMHDAKEYGSIIYVTPCDWDLLRRFAVPREEEGQLHRDIHGEIEASARLQGLINIGEALAQKYSAVVTNPPYMSNKGMSAKLTSYVQKQYFDEKLDMFAVFMDVVRKLTAEHGLYSMITQHSWMFLASFEKLRTKVLQQTIINMAHLGARAFEEISGEVVQTTAFTIRPSRLDGYYGTYKRLVDASSQDEKEKQFFDPASTHIINQHDYAVIPGTPVAYWMSSNFKNIFSNKLLYDYTISDGQNVTSDNGRFVRMTWEVEPCKIGADKKWRLYAKGGSYKKWYGNLTEVVDWSPEAIAFYHKESSARVLPEYLWHKRGITWSLITSNSPSFREMPIEATFDKGGSSVFLKNDDDFYYVLGLLNSKVFLDVVKMFNSTLNFQVKDIRSMPVIVRDKERVDKLVKQCIELAKEDWDSFETSFGFKTHPLVLICASLAGPHKLDDCFARWSEICEDRFSQLKAAEEELNRLFIRAYCLENELSPEVDNENVSVHLADREREIKSLLSYAIGCIFGRFSPNRTGIVYAGGEWDPEQYDVMIPDKDGIIPICDDEYFEDDVVGLIVKFVDTVFGSETLEENLAFIAQSLGGKGTPRKVIRDYFENDFYRDHCSVFSGTSGKKPIYWLFDSGKKNGFKCLIYMHRYQPDTIARIRTDYVHEQQSRYRTAIADLEQRTNGASTSERVKLSKQLTTLQAQAEEVRVYEEKIHHLADQMIRINLDDGIKKNYSIFQDVLAKLK